MSASSSRGPIECEQPCAQMRRMAWSSRGVPPCSRTEAHVADQSLKIGWHVVSATCCSCAFCGARPLYTKLALLAAAILGGRQQPPHKLRGLSTTQRSLWQVPPSQSPRPRSAAQPPALPHMYPADLLCLQRRVGDGSLVQGECDCQHSSHAAASLAAGGSRAQPALVGREAQHLRHPP